MVSLARIASVDYETDHKIQETISTEFHDRTILCIARKAFFFFHVKIRLHAFCQIGCGPSYRTTVFVRLTLV